MTLNTARLCSLLALTYLAVAAAKPGLADGATPAESVMKPGERITAALPAGTIQITAVDDTTRSYRWEGATRSVEMWARDERWHGSLGLYYPGPGEHWAEHNGITRGCLEEGQQHFKTVRQAIAWIKSITWIPLIYRNDGLVVGWNKTLARKQLNVMVWQILINNRKPKVLPGSSHGKIAVSHVVTETSPLAIAVERNSLSAVKRELASGSDPNGRNSVDIPVLSLAVRRGYVRIAKSLLAAGADPNVACPDGTPILVSAAGRESNELIGALLDGGADVNAACTMGIRRGMGPLMCATAYGAVALVKRLLANHANPNTVSYYGMTALKYAVSGNNLDIVRLLQEAGETE